MKMNNRFNEIVSSFVLFSNEFSPGDRLIDKFPNYFSFHSSNRKNEESLKTHLCNLTLQASADSQSAIVILDASIKNQVTTLIAHIHIHDNPVIKTVHHVINIITAEAKLFVIRCGINQAMCLPNIS